MYLVLMHSNRDCCHINHCRSFALLYQHVFNFRIRRERATEAQQGEERHCFILFGIFWLLNGDKGVRLNIGENITNHCGTVFQNISHLFVFGLSCVFHMDCFPPSEPRLDFVLIYLLWIWFLCLGFSVFCLILLQQSLFCLASLPGVLVSV